MIFKYKAFHEDLLCDCPDKDKCYPVIRTSYRFVHEDLENPNNFLPALIINKSRTSNECKAMCSGYALSFFTSLSAAEKKYLKIAAHAPLFPQTVGEYIAECDIRENDGVAEKVGQNGHFDLHEFEGASLEGRLKLIKRIQL